MFEPFLYADYLLKNVVKTFPFAPCHQFGCHQD